jgi:transposase InsO family protein
MARQVVPMDIRIAVAAFEAIDDGSANVSQICRQLGISRDTFYRYRARLEVEGFPGLLPRSTRPRSSPNQTPAWLVEVILAKRAELQRDGWDYGARSIQSRLKRAGVAVPSARTVHRVLVRAGLIDPQPAKRPRSSYRRFEHPAPNACWQLDGTWWPLAESSEACILRLTDDHSRLILASRAAPAENTAHAWALMETALARHGRPVMLLSDGGTAFTARRTTGGVSVFERRLAAHPPAHDLDELQRLLDAYDVLFNTDRPHQALDDATPAERYAATAKAVPAPGALPPPVSHTERTAGAAGRVTLGNRFTLNLGHQWTGATITVVRDDLDVAILHNGTLIRRLTIDTSRNTQVSGLKRGRPPTPLLSEPS